jgi:hypothetical protein
MGDNFIILFLKESIYLYYFLISAKNYKYGEFALLQFKRFQLI